MKFKNAAKHLPLVLSAIAAANGAPVIRSGTADNLNTTGAWTGGLAPTTGDTATWDAASTMTSTMGANNTWGALDVSAASGAVSISGANALLLDNTTDANTVFNTGANNFTWGTVATAGNFHINGVAGGTPVGSSTATGASLSGTSTITISGTGAKNWSSNATTNGITNISFTGTISLRGATIPAAGAVPSGNWLALGGGGGAASSVGTTTQTGSFALDTGDATSCGSFIVTQGWSGQYLKLNSLSGTGSIRADWGLSAGTQTRGIELDQAGDTTLSGSILVHNGSNQRRNVSMVKKGAGTLTLTGALGSSATAAGAVASLNFDIQGGAIQLGDGTTNPIYQNVANWDSASSFVIGSGATLRFKTASAFNWSRAITGGSGTVELTTDGDPADGAVTFTANHSAFSGNIHLNAGSLRMGPNLGSGTLTVKNGTYISVASAASSGTTTVGGLVLENNTESDFRLGTTGDKIQLSNTDSLTVPASGETHTINILNQPVGGGTVTLIDYTGTALTTEQFDRLVLGILPPGLATYQLVNNTANTSIDLLVTLESQVWKGSTDGNWDSTTTNWALASTPGTPAAFSMDNPALFDDSAAQFAVVVDAAGVSPLSTTFDNTSSAYTLTGGAITGTTSLEKKGGNSVTLSQSNSYSGGTVVNAGTLTLDGAANTSSGGSSINGGKLQIGSGGTTGDIGSGAITVAAGATLEFNRSNATPGTADLNYFSSAKMRDVSGTGDIVLTGGLLFFNYTGTGVGFSEAGSWNNFSGNLTIKGGSEFQTIRNGATAMGTGDIILGDATTSGALSQIEGNWTWTNDISLVGSDNRIRNRSLAGPRSLKLQGVISGSGGVTFEDTAGQMTDVNRGFILTNTNTLNGTLTIAAGTPLRVGGIPGNVDASATGIPADNFGTLGTATVVNNGTLTFSRKDNHTVGNAISGSGALRVGIPAAAALGNTTTQVVTLSGVSTYTGTTTVNNGTLVIAPGASIAGSGVSVEAGATIQGTGTVGAPLTATGTIAPGIGIGTIPVVGNTALAGTLAIEVDGAAADKLMVTGDLNLTGSTVTVSPTGAGFTAPSHVIAECTGTLTGLPTAPVGYQVAAVGNTVVLTPASGYSAWKTANSTTQTINGDHDNDGVSNGVEFFIGGPNDTSGFTPLPGISGTSVTYTKHSGYAGDYNTDFVIETSETLTGTWVQETVGGNVVQSGDSFTYTFPAGGPPRKFVRLKVTGPN